MEETKTELIRDSITGDLLTYEQGKFYKLNDGTLVPIRGFISISKFGLIYYTDGKNVYRATPGTVIDCISGYLQGRWECSVAHWNYFCKSVYEMPSIQI